jgi:hypothetical protein
VVGEEEKYYEEHKFTLQQAKGHQYGKDLARDVRDSTRRRQRAPRDIDSCKALCDAMHDLGGLMVLEACQSTSEGAYHLSNFSTNHHHPCHIAPVRGM